MSGEGDEAERLQVLEQYRKKVRIEAKRGIFVCATTKKRREFFLVCSLTGKAEPGTLAARCAGERHRWLAFYVVHFCRIYVVLFAHNVLASLHSSSTLCLCKRRCWYWMHEKTRKPHFNPSSL